MISLGSTDLDGLCLCCWGVDQSQTVEKPGAYVLLLWFWGILRRIKVLRFTAQYSSHGVMNQKEKTFYIIYRNLQKTFFNGFIKSIILTMKKSLVFFR